MLKLAHQFVHDRVAIISSRHNDTQVCDFTVHIQVPVVLFIFEFGVYLPVRIFDPDADWDFCILFSIRLRGLNKTLS